MFRKNFIFLWLLLVFFIGALVYLYPRFPRGKAVSKVSLCLPDIGVARYEEYGDVANITVGKTGQITEDFGFEVENIIANHSHGYELHKCGVYVLREFNFDNKSFKALPGFSVELWKYHYDGNGRRLLSLAGENDLGKPTVYYSYDFRVDPREKYLVLERSYIGKPDYSLVIKDLDTLGDVFVLTFDSIKRMNSNVELGNFDLGRWTDDGKYLWGTLFDGALDTAYYRVEAGTWETEIFSRPPDIPSGSERATSFAGYLAYADFPTFFGIDIVAQQEQERFRKEGREKHLYLYNLRTKEKLLLATTSDPEQRFKPKWLSDAELEYFIPGGERKVYAVQ